MRHTRIMATGNQNDGRIIQESQLARTASSRAVSWAPALRQFLARLPYPASQAGHIVILGVTRVLLLQFIRPPQITLAEAAKTLPEMALIVPRRKSLPGFSATATEAGIQGFGHASHSSPSAIQGPLITLSRHGLRPISATSVLPASPAPAETPRSPPPLAAIPALRAG